MASRALARSAKAQLLESLGWRGVVADVSIASGQGGFSLRVTVREGDPSNVPSKVQEVPVVVLTARE